MKWNTVERVTCQSNRIIQICPSHEMSRETLTVRTRFLCWFLHGKFGFVRRTPFVKTKSLNL